MFLLQSAENARVKVRKTIFRQFFQGRFGSTLKSFSIQNYAGAVVFQLLTLQNRT